eukprot:JP437053.1.p4 GENE.JP437053.1~~JP437053.1.p4  ORF type:complete len:68 (+),score=8.95 JP437053.1:122-325(+)
MISTKTPTHTHTDILQGHTQNTHERKYTDALEGISVTDRRSELENTKRMTTFTHTSMTAVIHSLTLA